MGTKKEDVYSPHSVASKAHTSVFRVILFVPS